MRRERELKKVQTDNGKRGEKTEKPDRRYGEREKERKHVILFFSELRLSTMKRAKQEKKERKK